MPDTRVDDINSDASHGSEEGMPNSQEQCQKDDLYYLESVVFKVTYTYM